MSAVALVVGGGGGIGASCGELLAERGYTVVSVDLAGAEPAGPDRSTVTRVGDVADRGAITRVVDEVERDVGPVEAYVNAAGVMAVSPLLPTDGDPADGSDAERIVAVNMLGTLYGMQAVGRHMTRRGTGSIVNVSSAAGRSARPHYAVYAASKAAVISLTRSAAAAWGPLGVRVNAVAPGAVDTPMLHRAVADEQRADVDPQTQARRLPLGRAAAPREIAESICFLISGAAGYVNGQCLNVCGGIEFS